MTLVEVVTALAISSVLLAAVGSAVVIASQALPRTDSPTAAAIDGAAVFERMASELDTALFLVERGDRAVTFTVPDRDADGRAETIRYTWSGVAGDSLVRHYNGGPGVELLGQVNQFHMTYDVVSVGESYHGKGVEDSADVLLATFGDGAGYRERGVTGSNWIGQYFLPDRARVGVSWRPTSIRVRARQAAIPGEVKLTLHSATAGLKPRVAELASSQLSYMQLVPWLHLWRELRVDTLGALPPDQGLCVVVRHITGNPGAYIEYDDTDGPGLLRTDNGGASWQYSSGKSLACAVYGRVTMAGAPQTVSRHYLTGITAIVRSGRSDAQRLQTRIPTLNHPELLDGLWSLDFDRPPTGVDVNGDGLGDWGVVGGHQFDAATLAGGLWRPAQILRSQPDADFATTTTIDLRARATTVGGRGAMLAINADWQGGNAVPLVLSLALESDGTQMLQLLVEQPDGSLTALMTLPGLPSSMVDVRLLIEPQTDTVNLRVNDVDRGSVGYTVRSLGGAPRGVMLFALDAEAQFDAVRVRIGGQP